MKIADVKMMLENGVQFRAEILGVLDCEAKREWVVKLHNDRGSSYMLTDHRTGQWRTWQSLDRAVAAVEDLGITDWTASKSEQ